MSVARRTPLPREVETLLPKSAEEGRYTSMRDASFLAFPSRHRRVVPETTAKGSVRAARCSAAGQSSPCSGGRYGTSHDHAVLLASLFRLPWEAVERRRP